ncbi:MAG: hypothetical protein QXW35_02700 [Candidatus Aenigmatarchaeota archaeon]
MREIILVVFLVLAMFSVSFSEIIVGDNAVSYTANIYFNVAVEERIAIAKQIVSIGLFGVVASMLLRTLGIDIASKKGILALFAIIISIAILVSTFSIL